MSSSSSGSKPNLELLAGSNVHAVMLYGAPGSEVCPKALVLASFWLGTGDPATAEASGIDYQRVCPSGAGNRIKLGAIVEGSDTSGEGDSENVIPLSTFLRTPPVKRPFKVCVFEEVDRLSSRAANALLKTLEEPPTYARFVLTTYHFGKVLSTIRSRCLLLACSYERSEDEEEWVTALSLGAPLISERMKTDRELAEAIWHLAKDCGEKRPGRVLELSERFEELTKLGSDANERGVRELRIDRLALFSNAYRTLYPERPKELQLVLRTHQFLLQNASSGVQMDAMFSKLLL
ncbi:MAG: hypothetical protein ACK4P3_02005 [Fimbriimonadaceae bacterium]